MKAAIVTFVRAYNYGAILQCYALSHKMRELGYDVEALDYFPRYFRDLYNVADFSVRSLPRRPSRMWGIYVALRVVIAKRNRGFETFIRRNIPMSRKCYRSVDELDSAVLPYDMYVSGSDQVWSSVCVPFDPVYFLRFLPASYKKRVSYAASFGSGEVPKELVSEYRNRLAGWDGYSVREASGAQILKNLLDVEAVRCCDPTLLLAKEDWDRIRKKEVRRRPYILIYRVIGGSDLLEYGKQLAEKWGLDVVTLSSTMSFAKVLGFEERSNGFEHIGYASPDQWLGLFAEAEYVLTDSFHGTVFSIINHKRFLTQINMSWANNDRAKELMQLLGLEDREISSDICAIDRQIDWKTVDDRLYALRRGSVDYLRQMKGMDE